MFLYIPDIAQLEYAQIRELFSKFGKVKDVATWRDSNPDSEKERCLIETPKKREATAAFNALNGKIFNDDRLQIYRLIKRK